MAGTKRTKKQGGESASPNKRQKTGDDARAKYMAEQQARVAAMRKGKAGAAPTSAASRASGSRRPVQTTAASRRRESAPLPQRVKQKAQVQPTKREQLREAQLAKFDREKAQRLADRKRRMSAPGSGGSNMHIDDAISFFHSTDMTASLAKEEEEEAEKEDSSEEEDESSEEDVSPPQRMRKTEKRPRHGPLHRLHRERSRSRPRGGRSSTATTPASSAAASSSTAVAPDSSSSKTSQAVVGMLVIAIIAVAAQIAMDHGVGISNPLHSTAENYTMVAKDIRKLTVKSGKRNESFAKRNTVST